ncbi:ATP-dependent endonuclease [Kluyvera intermedia]|uniref:ATP-dependent nuclease n=1 Tax=Kluyvera intermedia TaxID=61648 RepID=UPI0034A235E6
MRMRRIKISGWRSFDEKGISLDKLKKNNIIIGPNNAGKSNVSKYFMSLKTVAKNAKRTRDNSLLFHHIEHDIEESDTWAWLSQDIHCEIELDTFDWESKEIAPHLKSDIVLKALHRSTKGFVQLYCSWSDNDIISLNKPYKIYDKESGEYKDPKNKIKCIDDSYIYWNTFIDSLLFIDPIRHHNRDSKEANDFYFDGAKILDKLNTVFNDSPRLWASYITKMKEWLSDILNEDVVNVDSLKNDFRLHISRGGETILSSLSQLGTGVSQIIMLLSHLYLNKDKVLNVFLEEPESNLHPESVIKLMGIFNRELENHTFFITTHSSTLIDQLDEKWSINKISRDLNNSSKVFSCENLVQKYELLDDLGIRASQLLQSNMLIWVEGPSDAIYLKKWIDDISETKFTLGKDYSFIFYGGSNLSHHNILNANCIDAVDFLYTSRYVAIFCDSDCDSQDKYNEGDFKQRVKNVLEKLSELKKSEISSTVDMGDYVKIWITSGRETENYVPKEIFLDVLSDDNLSKKFIVHDKKNHDLIISDNLKKSVEFSNFDSFFSIFSKIYTYADGAGIPNKHIKKISSHYAGDKVKIAREVVKRWEEKHYTPSFKEEIKELVKMIKRANGK